MENFSSVMDILWKHKMKLYNILAKKANITNSQFIILKVILESEEPLTQNDFCKNWHIPKQTVNFAVKDLEKKGYLILNQKDSIKKNKNILLSEEGRKFSKKYILPVLNSERNIFKFLKKEEKEMLIYISNLLIQNIKKESELLIHDE